jgi:Lon protease-like protein
MNDDQHALANFPGTARLFPLPNLVLFPHVVQPLHVFEPRYRRMTADALAGDRLIAVVLLKPGWEEQYEGRPAIQPVACLGRVVADQLMPDGRYNLLVRGLARMRVLGEVADDRPYRTARGELLCDGPLPSVADAKALRKDLAGKVLPRFAAGPPRDQLRDLFQGELPLGALCDILGFALPFPVEHKQAMLEQLDVGRRAGRLLTLLDALVPTPQPAADPDPDRKFPPDFSAN